MVMFSVVACLFLSLYWVCSRPAGAAHPMRFVVFVLIHKSVRRTRKFFCSIGGVVGVGSGFTVDLLFFTESILPVNEHLLFLQLRLT